MTRHASAIAAAELRVAQSRHDLRVGLRRVQWRLSQPSVLAAAVAMGVLLGFALTRRGRTGAVAGMLATGLLRYGAEYLIAGADTPRRIR